MPDGAAIRLVEGGFPHSEIPGSKLVRSSPRLIAAYHVLHRLSAPRHPPNALKSLDCSHDRYPLCRSTLEEHRRSQHYGHDKDQRQLGPSRIQAAHACRTSPTADKLSLPGRTHSLFTMSLTYPNPEALNAHSRSRHEPVSLPHSLSKVDDAASKTWWSWTGSNRRPHACKARALPTELQPHAWTAPGAPAGGSVRKPKWWAWDDSNVRPHPYQGCALTT